MFRICEGHINSRIVHSMQLCQQLQKSVCPAGVLCYQNFRKCEIFSSVNHLYLISFFILFLPIVHLSCQMLFVTPTTVLSNINISVSDVYNILINLDPTKAMGIDRIGPGSYTQTLCSSIVFLFIIYFPLVFVISVFHLFG